MIARPRVGLDLASLRRTVLAVTAGLGAGVLIAGCATGGVVARPDGSATGTSTSVQPSSITWAYEQEFSGYNLNTPAGATQANLAVLNGVLSGFWQFGPRGEVLPTTDLGTYEKTADDPLTVRYTINPKAVWSDGTPISCDDIVFAWLANSGVTGPEGFAAASWAGAEDMTKPQCEPGGRVVVVYERPFADWAAQWGVGSILPSHVVARQGGLSKPWTELADDPRSPQLAKAIEFYNSGWSLRPGELKKDLMPSSGPYLIDSWTAGQSLTLKANPKWWGAAPRTPTVVIRFIGGTAQPQALQNREVQVIDPQPQVDLVRQLRTMGDSIRLTTAEAFRYEHLDFGFRGVFKDRTLREAFAKCVPRQRIVDNLVKPQNPDATVMQSRFVYPFQPQYPRFAADAGGGAYTEVDIAGARELLAGRTPQVRLGWYKDPVALNKRRADTVALIQSSCDQAGFRVVDAGTPTFLDQEWVDGNYDVALFFWTGSPLVAGVGDFFTTAAGNNTTGYASPRVDQLARSLAVEADPGQQIRLLLQIDRQLWADLVTIPLFAFPAVLATATDVRGTRFNATAAGVTWNLAEWTRG